MKATDVLMKEHEAIRCVLDSLEKACDALDNGKQVPARIFNDILDFIRNFTDRCHHGKEEDRLFPKYIERGMPSGSGPIAVMLAEHQEGRDLIRHASEQYEKWNAGDASASAGMTGALKGYIDLLRNHIVKENQILYPMGDRFITEEDDNWLENEFDLIEEHEMGPGVHEKYHAMIDALEEETAKL